MELLMALRDFLKDMLNDQFFQTVLLIFVFAQMIGLREDQEKGKQQIESLSESVRQQKPREAPYVRMESEERLRAERQNLDAAEKPTESETGGREDEQCTLP